MVVYAKLRLMIGSRVSAFSVCSAQCRPQLWIFKPSIIFIFIDVWRRTRLRLIIGSSVRTISVRSGQCRPQLSIICGSIFKLTVIDVNGSIQRIVGLEPSQCRHYFVWSYVTLVVMSLVPKLSACTKVFQLQLHGDQLSLRRQPRKETANRLEVTAGPNNFFCWPTATSETIFMNGIRRQISLVSSSFRSESSGGTTARSSLLAFPCAGILPRFRVRWQVWQIHTSWFTLRRIYCVSKTLADVSESFT